MTDSGHHATSPPGGERAVSISAQAVAPRRTIAGPDAETTDRFRSLVDPVSRECPTCHEVFPADFKVCPRDAVDLVTTTHEDPRVGTTLNETYRIVRVVGEGGMGRVYEASHRRLSNRSFAIKIMHRMHAANTELVERFRREGQTTASIHHENVIAVFDVDTTADGTPYIVCEYLEGEDVGAVLDRVGILDEATAARVIAQVCFALTAAHDHGIVHRDMKPENIYVTGSLDQPSIKLLDFGIARVDDPAHAMYTRTGMIMGTPAFMAPEQALGSRVDHRADIYAVGAILYRMLTGVVAHDRVDPSETLGALLTEAPVRPRALQPRLSAAFELVIQRAMARDPTDRYRSMRQLGQALAKFDIRPRPRGVADGSGATTVIDAEPTHEIDLSEEEQRGAIARVSREARGARPLILAIVALLWIGGAAMACMTVDALASILFDRTLTLPQLQITLVATLATLAVPAALWTRNVVRRAWSNSVSSIQICRKLRRVSAWVLGTVGLGLIIVQTAERVLPQPPLDGRLTVFVFGVAIVFGLVVSLRSDRETL